MRYGDRRTDCLASTEGDDFSVRLTKENVDDDGNEQEEEAGGGGHTHRPTR